MNDDFLNALETRFPLGNRSVLDIGCGNGARSKAIAARCRKLNGIDPDKASIEEARARKIENATFTVGRAEHILYVGVQFDAVLFTLSLHHVPEGLMDAAIREACRVCRPEGRVIFLEPTEEGSFFEAELRFEAGDGDERAQKKAALRAIREHEGFSETSEVYDSTSFRVESAIDFMASMKPKKNLGEISAFLEQNDFVLTAERRIHICTPR